MSSAGSRAGADGLENSGIASFLMIAAMVGFVFFALWFIAKDYILYGSLYASYYLFRFYVFLDGFIPFLSQTEVAELRGAIQVIPGMDPTKGDFKMFRKIAEMHGYFQRWLLIPIGIFSARSAYKNVVRFKYRRQIKNVYDLIDIQAEHFVASKLIQGLDILKDHPYIGPFATYTLPIDAALDHGLLWASKDPVDPDATADTKTMIKIPALKPTQKTKGWKWRRKQMPHHSFVLFDHAGANKHFASQLGPRWDGWQSLPPFEKALYAICCIQAASKQKEAQKLIDQIGMSFKMGNYCRKTGEFSSECTADFSDVDKLLEKYAKTPGCLEISKKHFHRYSVLIETLAFARTRGRLMHSNLLWVKWVNRTLGYGIIQLGGQAPYWEAAGIFAHMQSEKAAKKPLAAPHVAGAVLALEDRMRLEHWIDPGKYSEEEQQRILVAANAEFENNKERELADAARQQQMQTQPRRTGGTVTTPEFNKQLMERTRGKRVTDEDEP